MMKVKYFRENYTYSFNELMDNFKLEENVLIELIMELKLLEVIDYFPNPSMFESKPQSALEFFNKNKLLFSNSVYKFKFVGFIQSNKVNIIIICYPKYINKFNDTIENINYINSSMKIVLRVISKYLQRLSTTFEPLKTRNIEKIEEARNQGNLLGLMLRIIENYNEYGILYKSNEEYRLNNFNSIDWGKTINQTNPFISNNTPVYVEVYSKIKNTSLDNLLSIIHTSIIYTIQKNYLNLMDYFNLSSNEVDTPILSLESNRDFFIEQLVRELHLEYIDNRRRIIKDLLFFLEEYTPNHSHYQIVGTRYFHVIWEEVVRSNYGSDMNKSFEMLNLQFPSLTLQDKGNMLIKDYIEKPVWKINDKPIKSTNTFVIDSLQVNKDYFHIYDAKYYVLEDLENNQYNLIGINDITKEFLYQLAYKNVIDLNNLTTKNCFIIPASSPYDDNKLFATINMCMFVSKPLNLVPIEVYYRYPPLLYQKYMND